MITKPTTLILGAGASAPFGFPTGRDLLVQIITTFEAQSLQHQPTVQSRFKSLGFTIELINNFTVALEKSGKISVDAFLEHRLDYLEIGKACMAYSLITYENESNLYNYETSNWYQYLFSQLNTKFEDFDKNNLSIITFNYDRSLEHYLVSALMNSYNMPIGRCADMLRNIPIIHLHGDLGGLPYLDNELARDYKPDTDTESLVKASKRIKIIHEGLDKEPQFANAKQIISASDIVCFLGFGYHRLNMERLGFINTPNTTRTPFYKRSTDFYGSCFGMTNAERKKVSQQSGLFIKGFSLPDYYGTVGVLEFLRETGILHGN